MKQNIIEVLTYLFEVMGQEAMKIPPDHDVVMQKLENAGFNKEVIGQAINWLATFVKQRKLFSAVNNTSTRIFSGDECAKINLEARNFIIFLAHRGIIDSSLREIIISQLMNLTQREVKLVDAQWVALMVLLSDSDKSEKQLREFFLATMAHEA